MKNLIKFLISLIFLFNLTSSAFATQLPQPIVNYIMTKFPNAIIRFDGLVTLPDGTGYLPVFPINMAIVDDASKVIKTIPANSDFSAKPDLILFANNLSLLKIIKNPGESPTLLSSGEIPLTVKLGLLPQDLIVPENLIIPPELQVILGDLKIPIKYNEIKANNAEKKAGLTKSKAPEDPELKDFSNKIFYVSNFRSNSVSIISPQTGRAVKTISLSSTPADIVVTDDGSYILAACISSNKVAVIGTSTNSIIKEIDVGRMPTSLLVAKGLNIAYVANTMSSTISVIDLTSMSVSHEIKVTGMPTNLAISEDLETLFYSDSITGKIYKISLLDPNNIKPVAQANNISKIGQIGKHLFVLSRTDNSLAVYDLSTESSAVLKPVKIIKTDTKPVDFKFSKNRNKLYVLAAGANTINIIDVSTLEISKSLPLGNKGFPKSITMLNSINKALISNVDSYEVAIFDLDQEKIINNLPINSLITSLIVLQTKK